MISILELASGRWPALPCMIKDRQAGSVFIFEVIGKAWQTATAALRQEAKKFATFAPVAAVVLFRTDFAAGRYRA